MASNDTERLKRSRSLDPSFLQRPPSIHSIRELKKQNTFVSSGLQNDHEIIEFPTSDISVASSSVSNSPIHLSNVVNGSSVDSYNYQQEDATQQQSAQQLQRQHGEMCNVSEISGCIECVKAIPVFSVEEIEVGDHIVIAGAVYDHHGIVVDKRNEEFDVIEATNTISGAVIGIATLFGRKARIGRSTKVFNFQTQHICIVEYSNRYRNYSKLETARRAISFYEGKEIEFKYDLFDNNCEHFATWCVTNKKVSIQVKKYHLVAGLFWKKGFVGISDEQLRNEKEYENRIICEDCYNINKKLLSVDVRPITRSADVKKGDIIRYSYWNLWHEAVVLDVSHKENHLLCTIAHYAFCGPFSHRTIIQEDLQIHFDGNYFMLDYTSPAFHVYDPDTVVERAKRRLGEQHFVFFSNDSSHYARWCKLKLEKN